MKKFILSFILILFGCFLFAQEIVFPPELKWWIDEIQKVDKNVSIEKFKFSEETKLLQYDSPIKWKYELFPVLRKWNFFGNRFAYFDTMCMLNKEKSGKYSLSGEDGAVFSIFNKNKVLEYADFFGSSKCVDSFEWVRDNRIVLVGTWFVNINSDDTFDIDFFIRDYCIEDGVAKVREYIYSVKHVELNKIKHSWFEQRSDYFEVK